MNITTHGRPHLGAALGSKEFVEQFVSDRVHRWTQEILTLSDIAKSQPHAAHAAFIHGYVHKFSFLCRTIPNIEGHLHPLENCIRSNFIPSLTGRSPPNDQERDLLGLPPRLGGLGITNPTMLSSSAFEASKSISAPLSNLIEEQRLKYPYEYIEAQITAKKAVHQQRRTNAKVSASVIRGNVPAPLQRAMDLAQEKGAITR